MYTNLSRDNYRKAQRCNDTNIRAGVKRLRLHLASPSKAYEECSRNPNPLPSLAMQRKHFNGRHIQPYFIPLVESEASSFPPTLTAHSSTLFSSPTVISPHRHILCSVSIGPLRTTFVVFLLL
jgi:hypothetical protein